MNKISGFFQSRQDENGERKITRLSGAFSSVLNWLRKKWQSLRLPVRPKMVGIHTGNLIELTWIMVWATYVGQRFLNFDPKLWPAGGDYILGMQTNFIGTLLAKCGGCVLWNGFVNGGYPSFVDVQGSPFHPLVVLFTLFWGPINGTKITIIASLAMGGIAVWWLAKVLGLGRVARLWSATLAVASGFLAARMENGLVPLIFSVAACSLVIPPAIQLALTGKRTSAILLGIFLGLAVLSGQGYVQIGLALAILPALFVLLVNGRIPFRQVGKEFLLAGVLAFMLAGVFLVPFLHFYPHWAKEMDPGFPAAQPLEYEVLNLVIRDADFYRSESLNKYPFPFYYSNYIGWVPVMLAVISFHLSPARNAACWLFSWWQLVWYTWQAVHKHSSCWRGSYRIR
jgi:hypothetical protein